MPYPSLLPAAAAGPQAPSKVQRKSADSSASSTSGAACSSGKSSKKSEYVKSGACERCRKGKRKCDGGKPVCDACRKRGIGPDEKCVYQNLEGLSRIETLKHNAQSLRRERDLLRAVIKDMTLSGSTDQDNSVMERLRDPELNTALGEEITQLLHSRGEQLPPAGVWSSVTAADVPVLQPSMPSHSGSSVRSDAGADQYDQSPPTSPYREFGPNFKDFWQKNYNDVSTKTMAAFMPTHSFTPRQSQIESSHFQAPSNSYHPALSATSSVTMSPTQSMQQPSQMTTAEDVSMYQFQKYGTDFEAVRANRVASLDEEPTSQVEPEDRPDTAIQNARKRKRITPIYTQLPAASAIRANGYPPDIQQRQMLNYSVPEYMIPPLTESSQSPFSLALASFRDTARFRISQGWNKEKILGPIDFDMSRLVHVALHDYDPASDHDFSVPSWVINLVKAFPLRDAPSLVSGAYQVASIMRWLIDPTPENYAAINPHMRPTRGSRFIPHATELDFIALPDLRNAIIKRPRDFMPVFLKTGSWDWPDDVPCVHVDPKTGFTILTPAFKAHIADGWNWGHQKEILDIIPELEGKCRIRD